MKKPLLTSGRFLKPFQKNANSFIVELDKHRSPTGSSGKSMLIVDYEQRLKTQSAREDKIKYAKEIKEFCKNNPYISKLLIQNEVIYIAINKEFVIKITKEFLNKIEISDNDLAFKAFVRGIPSREYALSRLSNNKEWVNEDPLNFKCTALCYVLNSHPDDFKKFISLLKRAIAFQIGIDYNLEQKEVNHE